MSQVALLQSYRSDLHISSSQIKTFLGCPLKYSFQYVERLPKERQSVATAFGKALHTALERYYRTLKEQGRQESVKALTEYFSEAFLLNCREEDGPWIFKKDLPDRDAALAMGKSLLETYVDQVDLEGWEIVAVEYPIAAPMISPEGKDLDIQLIGVIDLLLKSPQGELVVVDHKSARNSYTQESVDEDLQLSAYGYLLTVNGLVDPKAELNCRLDVLRKLKTPKLEHHLSRRGTEHRNRFAGVATQVLRAIENQVFYPVRSWMCADCSYSMACRRWCGQTQPVA